jgi:ribA/ribD-fused uncharacterized protein
MKIDRFEGRYSFLSNFYPCKIVHQGITYPSTEHYYVAQKVNDDQIINGKFYPKADVREMISNISTPGQVKRFGRALKLRSDWDNIKLGVMEWCLREKFKEENLKEMLLQTGDQELIESNYWHDVVWGVCTCQKCGNKGENNLGKLLMKIRGEIKSEQSKRPSLEDVLFPKDSSK